MSAFENFVSLELPKRPAMLTLGNTGYDNDPNGGSAPGVIQNSPQGTLFFRTTGNLLYVKDAAAAGTWALVGTGSSCTTGVLALVMIANVSFTGKPSERDIRPTVTPYSTS